VSACILATFFAGPYMARTLARFATRALFDLRSADDCIILSCLNELFFLLTRHAAGLSRLADQTVWARVSHVRWPKRGTLLHQLPKMVEVLMVTGPKLSVIARDIDAWCWEAALANHAFKLARGPNGYIECRASTR